MLELADGWARRYGRRPCELLTSDPVDVAFDLMVLEAGVDADMRRARSAQGPVFPVVVVGGV